MTTTTPNNPHFCSNGFTQKMNILLKLISTATKGRWCTKFLKKILDAQLLLKCLEKVLLASLNIILQAGKVQKSLTHLLLKFCVQECVIHW